MGSKLKAAAKTANKIVGETSIGAGLSDFDQTAQWWRPIKHLKLQWFQNESGFQN